MNDILLTLKPWYPSISAFLFFTVVRYIYKNFFIRLLRRLNNKVSFSYGEDFLNAFETPINIALFIIAFYAAINLSPLASIHDVSFTDRILRTIIVTNFFWGLYNLIDTTHGVFFDLLERFGIQTDEAIANILATVFRMIIIMLGFVTVAREWNYDISAFIASLSIGSLAVAFAAKDALANVFGSMIILLDKPFKIGDWIKANGIEGIVESVSFRSTCIRTFPAGACLYSKLPPQQHAYYQLYAARTSPHRLYAWPDLRYNGCPNRGIYLQAEKLSGGSHAY